MYINQEWGDYMILSIGFEAILESKYFVKEFHTHIENRTDESSYNLGGDSIVHALILNSLGADVFAAGFLGGISGEYIFSELKRNNIYNDFIRIKDETRKDILIIEDNKVTSIIDKSPRITREELGSFYELYNNIVHRFDLICGIGPLAIGLPENIYYDLINLANKNGKRFILNARGPELAYGLEANPFMIILDKQELESLSKIKINFLGDAVKLGRGIIESGVEVVVIDLDEKGNLVLTKEMGYRLDYPGLEVEKMGQDKGYTVAGYSFGLDRGYDFETSMKLGYGFRIAHGHEGLDRVDMRDIKAIMSKIEILPIYY